MYSIVNNNTEFITKIDSKTLTKHFKDYMFLANIDNLLKDEEDYKKKFKTFWGMNAARQLANNDYFYSVYFEFLKQGNTNKWLNFNDLLLRLKESNAGFQFSFATKAVHILDRNLPIYDVNVRRFYFLSDIDSTKSWEQKLEIANKYYNFLSEEYERIQKFELLTPTIKELNVFLSKLDIDINQISEIKKIDSIIWAWVDYLNKGAIINKTIVWNK